MIGTLVAIAVGLGIAISGAVIVWGGIENTMAGSSTESEHRAQRRIANGITGLIWMSRTCHLLGGAGPPAYRARATASCVEQDHDGDLQPRQRGASNGRQSTRWSKPSQLRVT